MNILIKNATITTPTGKTPAKGAQMKNIAIKTGTDIFIRNGTIAKIGKNLPENADKIINANGKTIIPGFIDSHTHLIFPTERIDEYEWKLQGMSYMEIAKKGGGILNTARKTAEISEEKLLNEL